MPSEAAPSIVPAVIGHRGARGLWPENTLAGFDATAALGVDGVELDVGLTRDGVVVVHHDPTLNRDTTRDASGNWLKRRGPTLRELDYANLSAYDVGALRPRSRYGLRFRKQTSVDNERIPTLDETLERLFTAGLEVTVEVKSIPAEQPLMAPPEALAEAVVACFERCAAFERVCLSSFDWRVLSAARRLVPTLPISCLTVESPAEDSVGRGGRANAVEAAWTDGLLLSDFAGSVAAMVAAFGSNSWSPFVGNINAQAIAQARQRELSVVAWTVNAERDIARVLRLGVDGIITDYPDRLRTQMHARGLTLPPSYPPTSPSNTLQSE